MKRLFTLFTGLCVMLLAGCNDEYDDSALVKRLDDFEQRLERLERLCNDMNTNLGSMQTIVTALDRGDYITSVEPLTENGSMVGYTIRFAKGTPIVVYNGKPGTAPVVSVKKDTDGIYYWTLDGEWITDGGKKLPVSGQDGTSPKLKIEEEYWYISYDDGTTWTKLDKATGEKGDDGAGILVDMDENYVYFTLPDGRTVAVPRAEGGSEPQPSVPHIPLRRGTGARTRSRALLCHFVEGRQAPVAHRRLGGQFLQRRLRRRKQGLCRRLRSDRRSVRRRILRTLSAERRRHVAVRGRQRDASDALRPERRQTRDLPVAVAAAGEHLRRRFPKRWKTPTERPSTGVTGRWST